MKGIENKQQAIVSSDLVSRQYLLDEYDRLHVGPPGRARKIIEDAPSAQVDKSYELWKESYEVLKEEYDNLTQCDDCISRQEAIKAIEAVPDGNWKSIRYSKEILRLPSVEPEPLSDAYMEAVWTWLLKYQIKVAVFKGSYTPYEVLSWVVKDWRKDHERSD